MGRKEGSDLSACHPGCLNPLKSAGAMTSPQRHCEARSNRQQVGNDLYSMDLHRRALGRAGPGTFVLTQKYPKSQVSR